MKKKTLLFLIIIILFNTKIYAQTMTTSTCIETPEGNLKIKWSGKTNTYSNVWGEVCKHSCKNTEIKRNISNSNDCQKELKARKECNYNAGDSKNGIKTNCKCIKDNNDKYTLVKQDCKEIVNNNGECELTLEPTDVRASEYILLEAEQINGQFETEGDVAYCLQPNKKGPGKIKEEYQNYTLDKTFDVSVCRDSLHNKNGEADFRCGLAHILYETVKETEDGKYVSNGKYSYDSITLALRLWVAKYADKTITLGNPYTWNNEQNSSDLSVSDLFDGIDDSEETNGIFNNSNYYYLTANAILDGTYNDKVKRLKNLIKKHELPQDNKNHITAKKLRELISKESLIGLIYCKTDKGCSVPNGIELFNSAVMAYKDSSKFLGGKDFNKEVPVIETHTQANVIITEIKLPESLEEINCSEEEVKMGKCSVHVEYFDEDDNNITDQVQITGSCGKKHCTFTASYYKLCKKGGVKRITTKIYIDNYKWQRNNGYVRFYTHATDPQKYQKFITFAFNIEKCEEGKTNNITEETVETWCKCEDSCENLNSKRNIPKMCDTNSDYTITSIIDPNMNCILNSCYENAKNKYEYTDKLYLDSNVCRAYCREELLFYTPGMTTTYAGRQFQFDLGTILKNNNIITKTIVDDISPIHKITGLLIRKKQCTSKIDYNGWKEEFNSKLNLLVNAYNSNNTNEYNRIKKDVSEWIYKLQNCNFYAKNDINDPYNLIKDFKLAKDYVINENSCKNESNCPELTISYDDPNYGKANNLGRVIGSIDYKTVETYYCKNNDKTICYEYKSNDSVEINAEKHKSNSLETISYKKCENDKCSDEKIQLPSNDYATFIVETEFDFYQQKQYQVDALSGIVSEAKDNSDSNKLPIEKYSYPVSNNIKVSVYDSKTNMGGYNFNYSLSNASSNQKSNINYSCKYNIEDKPITNDIELEFIYRSVNLSNLFPNGIENRPKNNNWSNKLEEIENIQRSASDIFTNDDYLDYQFVLTPQTIKDIKNYNKEQRSNGGYLNNTLINCEYIDSNGNKCDPKNGELCEFRNCKSTFLEKDIKNYSGIKISGNKVGGK